MDTLRSWSDAGLLRALAFAALAVFSTLDAQASDNVYTVANYPIEAQAENAVAAKEKALADGQQAAFRSLLKRLIPVTAYPQAKRLASVKGADLVEGVKVRSERNSSTDYIASFDFSFQAKGVRDLLRREGIPFTDDQAPTVTLVPVWRSAADTAAQGRGCLDQHLEGAGPRELAHADQAAATLEEHPGRDDQRACRRRRKRLARARGPVQHGICASGFR